MDSSRWALGAAWATAPRLFVGVVVAAATLALVPAGTALSIGALASEVKDAFGSGGQDLTRAGLWLALAAGLALVGAACGSLRSYCESRLGDELNLRLSLQILEHAGTLDLVFFEDPDSQDLLARAQRNPGRQCLRFLEATIDCGASLFRSVTLLGVLVWIEPVATPFLVLAAIPFMGHRWRLARERYRLERAKSTQRRWSAYFHSLLTDQAAMPAVKILGVASQLIRRFEDRTREVMDPMRGLYRRQAVGRVIGISVQLLGAILVVTWVGWRALSGDIAVGVLVTYALAALRLRGGLTTLATRVSEARESSLFAADMIEYLDRRPTVLDRPTSSLPDLRGDIELVEVSFSYPDAERPALERVSLRIPGGSTVAVVGHNGAGKTTLAKLLLRLYDVSEGEIRIAGRDLRSLPLGAFHARVGAVFEAPLAFEATAADNIALGDWPRLADDASALRDLTQRAEVQDIVEALPEGLETMLGRRFGQVGLSAGQWQRIAIARAMARRPELLILDEPTAKLDVQAERRIFRAVKRLAQEATTVLISHRFSTVLLADWIFVMEEGRLVEEGTHDQLLAAGGLYAHLFHLHRQSLEGVPA